MGDYDEFVDGELAGLDSPTDFDEHEMNPDDCAPEGEEYYRDEGEYDDGQPDEQQEWHDFDPDC